MYEVRDEITTGCLKRLKTVAGKQMLLNKVNEWRGLREASDVR
jgi:hypothetical protein